MVSFLPVPLSLALTVRIEFSSISNVTSICGTPLGAGGIPLISNLPKLWLSLVRALSPSKTAIETVVYWSWYVVNTYDFLAGITVPLGMIFVITPPTVSIPSVNGVTSIKRMSFVSSDCSPPKIPPWTAAP